MVDPGKEEIKTRKIFSKIEISKAKYMVFEIYFQPVKCRDVTWIHENFDQLFIPIQNIQGD